MSAVWLKQSFERVTTFQRDNSKAKSIKAKIMELIALDNQPFSVVGDVGVRRLVEHRSSVLFSDVALPELHSNSVTVISLALVIKHNLFDRNFCYSFSMVPSYHQYNCSPIEIELQLMKRNS